jgi:colicin import membrane protein
MNPKLIPTVNAAKYLLYAIICIAGCAIFQRASAQNALQSTTAAVQNDLASTDARDASERAERERISQERQRANADYAAANAYCYQRFQVNACLSQARTKHNAQISDLKRQEISLNDVQRKRRGAEQLRKVEEKTSPQRQEDVAQQRGKALANDAKRQERQNGRAAPVGQAPSAPRSAGKAPQAKPSNGAEKQARMNSKALGSQERAAAAARAKAKTEARQNEAAAHAASVQERQKQKKKPAAATLPIPAN